MPENDRDPFAEWREVQDHRYDPGYYLGGRIHPLYRRARLESTPRLVLALASIGAILIGASLWPGELRFGRLVLGAIFIALALANHRESKKRGARPRRGER